MDINKRNSKGKFHGYWEAHYVRRHYYQGRIVGVYLGGLYKCHFNIDEKEIGCEYISFSNSQFFHNNKTNKKFGEKIIWK